MMTQNPILYRNESIPDLYLRLATWRDDAQLIELIKEVMPSNGMLLSFERFPSYLYAVQVQSKRPQSIVIVHEQRPDEVLGMLLVVWKDCYIDQQLRTMCYLCDLRFSPQLRGNRAMRLIMDYFKYNHPHDTLFQSIILSDNRYACEIFHAERPNYLTPYQYDLIYTYNVGRVKRSLVQDKYQVVELDESWIDALQYFLADMQVYYNFLPDYDFNEIVAKKRFWGDLKLEDFYLILDAEQQIVGVYGLWNQKKIKQIRVVKYDLKLLVFRPIYNLYTHFRGGFKLPKTRGMFDYLLMHSPICAPQHLDVFERMLSHAMQQTKLRQHKVFSLTLAESDPRRSVLKHLQSNAIQAKHAFHSFFDNPIAQLDRSKISYFDLCRM
ncbi:hypothetical protein EC844_13235 [Acinetobacter calcoaceticus]|uniref:N-acetyltransferase domain-containing protein n=1 Tax=Acinetobacter calcoaceticus TaxID=471 RepID=A0A4V6NJ59_ACICA|nr:hypothetical protein EC844_13235 [Acinetobacter calcoaceticus]